MVRASITLQNPESNLPNVQSAVRMIYEKYGLKGLWHGTVSKNAFIIETLTLLTRSLIYFRLTT